MSRCVGKTKSILFVFLLLPSFPFRDDDDDDCDEEYGLIN